MILHITQKQIDNWRAALADNSSFRLKCRCPIVQAIASEYNIPSDFISVGKQKYSIDNMHTAIPLPIYVEQWIAMVDNPKYQIGPTVLELID